MRCTERERERRRRVPFLALTDTDPAAKSAGGGWPITTGERASRREREGRQRFRTEETERQ